MQSLTEIGNIIVWISGIITATGIIFACIKKPVKIAIQKKNKKEEELLNSLASINKTVIETQNQNQEQYKMLTEFDQKINNLANQIDKNEIDRIRWEILNFANMCKKQEDRTNKDEFQHIFRLYDKYEELIKKHNLENGHILIEMKYIRQLYLTLSNQHKL